MTHTTPEAPPADLKMQRSSRDATSVPAALAQWLTPLLPPGAEPSVVLHAGVDANGMSSETMLLDVTWTDDGEQRTGRYVARVAPSAADFPVFASYELADQYDAMRIVAEQSDVPVPAVAWMEPTGSVLGTPFFLMGRVDGVVPRDVLPYNLGGNWLFDASPEDQRRLQDNTVKAIAGLHAIPDAANTFAFLDPARHGFDGATPLARNLARVRGWYEFAQADVGPSPLAERALAWLEAHLPDESQGSSEPVLCWGDARIGNVIYDDFAPVAVLDWEMVTLGPREFDVSWLILAHQVFESIATMLELPGMPDFLREDDVVATYRELTGVELGDLTWFHVFGGLEWCIVFMRTGARQIHFGEIERPDDIESLMHCRAVVERLLDQVGA